MDTVLLRLPVLPQFEDELRGRGSVVGDALYGPVQAEQAADVAESGVVAADLTSSPCADGRSRRRGERGIRIIFLVAVFKRGWSLIRRRNLCVYPLP
jgi:hypothetical protein